MIVGFLTVFGALFSLIAWRPPLWVDLAVWPLVGLCLSLALLRPVKGLMVAAQVRNRSGEGRAS
jgi:uncharacterized protein (DUF983 family)